MDLGGARPLCVSISSQTLQTMFKSETGSNAFGTRIHERLFHVRQAASPVLGEVRC
jgi:hypothetical protein